jgi:hypothetical protein
MSLQKNIRVFLNALMHYVAEWPGTPKLEEKTVETVESSLEEVLQEMGTGIPDAPEDGELYGRKYDEQQAKNEWYAVQVPPAVTPTLQEVTNAGSSTTHSIQIADGVNPEDAATVHQVQNATETKANKVPKGTFPETYEDLSDVKVIAESKQDPVTFGAGIVRDTDAQGLQYKADFADLSQAVTDSNKVADAKQVQELLASASGAHRMRGVVVSAKTAIQVYEMFNVEGINTGGTGYSAGDTLVHGFDAQDLVLTVESVAGNGVVQTVSVVRQGISISNPGTTANLPFNSVSGTGSGFFASVSQQTAQGSVLADVTAPELGDIVRVIKDELHSGNSWEWIYADLDDGGVMTPEWIPYATAEAVNRDFTVDPIQTSEIANGAVTDLKVGDLSSKYIYKKSKVSTVPKNNWPKGFTYIADLSSSNSADWKDLVVYFNIDYNTPTFSRSSDFWSQLSQYTGTADNVYQVSSYLVANARWVATNFAWSKYSIASNNGDTDFFMGPVNLDNADNANSPSYFEAAENYLLDGQGVKVGMMIGESYGGMSADLVTNDQEVGLIYEELEGIGKKFIKVNRLGIETFNEETRGKLALYNEHNFLTTATTGSPVDTSTTCTFFNSKRDNLMIGYGYSNNASSDIEFVGYTTAEFTTDKITLQVPRNASNQLSTITFKNNLLEDTVYFSDYSGTSMARVSAGLFDPSSSVGGVELFTIFGTGKRAVMYQQFNGINLKFQTAQSEHRALRLNENRLYVETKNGLDDARFPTQIQDLPGFIVFETHDDFFKDWLGARPDPNNSPYKRALQRGTFAFVKGGNINGQPFPPAVYLLLKTVKVGSFNWNPDNTGGDFNLGAMVDYCVLIKAGDYVPADDEYFPENIVVTGVMPAAGYYELRGNENQ